MLILSFVVAMAAAVASDQNSLAIIVLGALAAISYRIRVEENALIGYFGDRYREYAGRTKRLIPWVY